ncbi:MAG: DNA repair protein RecO [Deltaproteobacteria bacterium]|nr:DNA repair protein RecO [Deltaproteobacteria bacterium]
MTTLLTEALILRNVDFGESDRILHLLTPETGRITVIAKGARRSKKRFPGTLDLFNHLDVQIERRRPTSMARLEAARLRATLHEIRTDPRRFALGCYLLELLDRLAPEGGARLDHRRLFDFALGVLRLIDLQAPDLRMRVLLEIRALDALGIGPELSLCVRCGEALADEPAGAIHFHVAEGGPCCRRCIPEDPQLLPVHRGTLRALERSRALAPEQLGRLALGGGALDEARALVTRFLRFHVGLDLRSVAFLDQQWTAPDASRSMAGQDRP